MVPLPLPKRTKSDILEEYEKLQEKYEELVQTSKMLHSEESNMLLSKVQNYTMDHVTNAVSDLKNSINSTLNELAQKMATEAEKLREIREAVDLSKKKLEMQYHIEIAAQTFEELIREYESKKSLLEKEHKIKNLEFEEETIVKKRDWKHEQEEYEYKTRVTRERNKESFEREQQKKEQALEERIAALKNQEIEISELRRQAGEFSKKIETAQEEREKFIRAELTAEFHREISGKKQEWDSEKNMYELRLSTLQNEIKRQNGEITALRLESEKATKKAQELAIKIVESQTGTVISQKERDSVKTEN